MVFPRPFGFLIVVSNPLFTSRHEQIVTLANYHRIPAIYPLREYVASGGLVSYGAQHQECLPSVGSLRGSNFEGCQTRRPADNTANKIRTGDQP